MRQWSAQLVLDFATTTTIQSYVDSNGPIAEAAATGLFAQLLRGLAHIHGFGVAHSGVAPSSMLFDEGARILKITDFGHARLSSTGFPLSSVDEDATVASSGEGEMSPELSYQAPEQLFRRSWNERADIWAAGLSLHFTMLSRLPFDVQDEITVELLKAGRLPIPLSGNCGIFGGMPARASNTLRRCLAVLARSRPSAIELLKQVAVEESGGTTTRPSADSQASSAARQLLWRRQPRARQRVCSGLPPPVGAAHGNRGSSPASVQSVPCAHGLASPPLLFKCVCVSRVCRFRPTASVWGATHGHTRGTGVPTCARPGYEASRFFRSSTKSWRQFQVHRLPVPADHLHLMVASSSQQWKVVLAQRVSLHSMSVSIL
eukprot:CAMPEP_0176248202 /NCGR_PEP_ID=MMETSP0121_2-20121125/33347_1 /TAXON_ID=160619 /ORGANISM="Kryptoperidinium foliaceum, Strain CCMP 1326" /LENGTH=374 /DNA_ID=CAMNT_0017587877 /DNA_START=98 /DNA_END=1219 /DNA_ORIENTATION=+